MLLAFGLTAYKTGVEIATATIACFLVGYLNIFYLLDTVFPLVRRERRGPRHWGVVVLTLFANAALVYLGFGVILGGVTVGLLMIDLIVVRWRRVG